MPLGSLERTTTCLPSSSRTGASRVWNSRSKRRTYTASTNFGAKRTGTVRSHLRVYRTIGDDSVSSVGEQRRAPSTGVYSCVINLPPPKTRPATAVRTRPLARWQVGGKLVAALVTRVSRIPIREFERGGNYDNLSQNFCKGTRGKAQKAAERQIGITIGTTCHPCHPGSRWDTCRAPRDSPISYVQNGRITMMSEHKKGRRHEH
jgi:hypothetical protein